MPISSPAKKISGGLFEISLPAFELLCHQYISFAYNTVINKNVKLPRSSLAEYDSVIFKISKSETIESFSKEIREDIKYFSGAGSYTEAVYFNINDKFISPLVKRKIKSSLKKSKLNFSILTYSEIINYLHISGGYRNLQFIVNSDLKLLYSNAQPDYKKYNTIIDEIFDYVFNKEKRKTVKPGTVKMNVDRLNAKIAVNFGIPEREKVKSYYLNVWGTKEIVEQYISKNFDARNKELFALRSVVQKKFSSVNWHKKVQTPVNYIGTMMDVAESLIPPGKNHIAEYHALSEAIVLYFFEYCDFGERYINEEPSLFHKQLEQK